MRNITLAIFSAAATLTVASAGSPALAGGRQQDTYCLQGKSYGYPGNCQFSTYEQCLATASGTNSGCGINPMRAYSTQQQQRGGGYHERY